MGSRGDLTMPKNSCHYWHQFFVLSCPTLPDALVLSLSICACSPGRAARVLRLNRPPDLFACWQQFGGYQRERRPWLAVVYLPQLLPMARVLAGDHR